MTLIDSEEPVNPPGQPRPGLSERLRRLRGALNLPIATIALLIAVATLVIVLGVLSLPPGLLQPAGPPSATPPATPTGLPAPSPTPTLAPGVQRVVIAHFAGSGADFDVARSIEGSLLAALASEGLSADVQVSLVADEVASYEDALALLDRSDASLVVWGHVEAGGVRAGTTVTGEGLPELPRVHGDPAPVPLIFPPDMEFYLSRDLGADMTFLSLATIGQLNLVEGDYEGARARFQSALLAMPAALPREARDRGVGIVRFYYGLVALHSGDALAALQDYSQSLRLYPDLTSTYNNRGVVYYALGDYETAQTEFETVLQDNPRNAIVLGNRALAKLMQGDADGALLDAERLLTLAPDDARSHNLRGLVHYRLGEGEAALEDFRQAAALDPTSGSAQFNYAAALDALGRGGEAVDAYTQLLESHPDDALALAYRGDAYLHQGMDAQAVTDYDEALKLDLELVYGYQQRARFYIARGNFSVALVDLEAALRVDGQDPRTQTLLGDLYAAQGDFNAALEAYDSALEAGPTFADAFAGRGGVRRAQRSFINARGDLESALQWGGPTVPVELNLGLVYTQLGQYAEAVEAFQYVIDESPDHDLAAQAFAGLALALEGQQKRDESESALTRALAVDDRLADPDYLSGELYWSAQQIDRLGTILTRLES